MITTYEYSELAFDAYQPGQSQDALQSNGWTELANSDDTTGDGGSGFDGIAYQNISTGEVVIAFRGTEPGDIIGGDGYADLQIGMDQIPDQYEHANQFYQHIQSIVDSREDLNDINLTGHSLGGALAQLLSAETGLNTTTFNAPGVSHLIDNLNERYGLDIDATADHSQIENYNAVYDAVSSYGDQIGTSINVYIDSITSVPDWLEPFVAFFGGGIVGLVAYLADQHSMENMRDLFAQTGEDWPGLAELWESLDLFQNLENDINNILEDMNLTWDQFLDWVEPPPRRDPLALDLDGDGIETLAADGYNGVLFDQNGDGVKRATGWVASDDGLLVLDRNGNGTIDNGTELFGNNTPTAGGTAADGLSALADLDTNLDGRIDASDAQFADLNVWRDLNSDGISQADELFTLNDLGIGYETSTSPQLVRLEIADKGKFGDWLNIGNEGVGFNSQFRS